MQDQSYQTSKDVHDDSNACEYMKSNGEYL